MWLGSRIDKPIPIARRYTIQIYATYIPVIRAASHAPTEIESAVDLWFETRNASVRSLEEICLELNCRTYRLTLDSVFRLFSLPLLRYCAGFPTPKESVGSKFSNPNRFKCLFEPFRFSFLPYIVSLSLFDNPWSKNRIRITPSRTLKFLSILQKPDP